MGVEAKEAARSKAQRKRIGGYACAGLLVLMLVINAYIPESMQLNNYVLIAIAVVCGIGAPWLFVRANAKHREQRPAE